MYLSKSKYCNAVQCNKMLWLDKFCPLEKEDISNTSVLDNGSEVGELAKGLFGDYIDIDIFLSSATCILIERRRDFWIT